MVRDNPRTTVRRIKEKNSTTISIFRQISSSFSFRCDAEPKAVARYVLALVKKDKPLDKLRENCIDRLDVFLDRGKNENENQNQNQKMNFLFCSQRQKILLINCLM